MTGDQFRVTGKAFLSPRLGHPLQAVFQEQHAKRLSPPGVKAGIDWEAERWRIFGKLIPPIRAGFARPAPGTPLKAIERIGEQADDKEDYDPSTWAPLVTLDSDKALIDKAYYDFALL